MVQIRSNESVTIHHLKFMRVRSFQMYQFLATLIRGREHCHFRSPKCPAPGTSGPLFFPEVQNATFQNGSGGLVVPRYFCQTDIGLWPCTSCALFFPEVQNATFQIGSMWLVVPSAFCQAVFFLTSPVSQMPLRGCVIEYNLRSELGVSISPASGAGPPTCW